MGSLVSLDAKCDCPSALSKSSGSCSSTGMAYWPVSHLFRSRSAHLFEQNGRYFSDLGSSQSEHFAIFFSLSVILLKSIGISFLR